MLKKKVIWIPLTILVVLMGGIGYLFATNEEVAAELRQVQQPRPNRFFVGIDVSATISTDTLEKLKDGLTDRLRNFVGDGAVSYQVVTFGNPGCGSDSFRDVVSTQSPEDALEFQWKVEEKIREINITKVAPRETAPLTTPLNCFMQHFLPENVGGRVIIFSDLMNDDSDCREQFTFPEKVVVQYGQNKNGQIIFLYQKPHLTDNPELNQRNIEKQEAFIERVRKLSLAGKVRVFFFLIPDDPLERLAFIKFQLKNGIPATTFDVVMERASKVVHTIVSAVRG